MSKDLTKSTVEICSKVLLGLAAAVVVYLLVVAVLVKAGYYDSYDIAVNAQRVARVQTKIYFWPRAVFLPVILAPVFRLSDLLGVEGFALSGVVTVGFLVLQMGLCYRIFLEFLDKSRARLAAALIPFNVLVIHQAPFLKEDLPSAVLVTAVFYLYIKAHRIGRTARPWAAALLAASVVLSKYNLIMPLPLFVGLYELISQDQSIHRRIFNCFRERPRLTRLIVFAVVPALSFFIVPPAVYWWVDRVPAYGRFWEDFLTQVQSVSTKEPPVENVFFLLAAFGWPLIVMALVGMAAAWKKKIAGRGFFFLWFIVFFMIQSFVIGHKEARYLFPLFPALYFFIAVGMGAFLSFLEKRLETKPWKDSARKRVLAAAALAVLLPPVTRAALELKQFRDPFYYNDFARRVSRKAEELAGENTIYWIGSQYTLHPRKYIFHPDDEYGYLYHFYANAVTFYTKKKLIPILGVVRLYEAEDPQNGVGIPRIGEELPEDGGVLIVSPEEKDYTVRDLPVRLKPLYVEKLRKHRCALQKVAAGRKIYQCPALPGLRMELLKNPRDGGWDIRLQGLPNRIVELYLPLLGQERFFNMVPPELSDAVFEFPGKMKFPYIILMTYEDVHVFPAP